MNATTNRNYGNYIVYGWKPHVGYVSLYNPSYNYKFQSVQIQLKIYEFIIWDFPPRI